MTSPTRRIVRHLMIGTTVVGGMSLTVLSQTAAGFGTINSLGQHAEHEQITRVLQCDSTLAPRDCFQTGSIDALAGKAGEFGAVGSPDIPPYLLGHPENHCDDADYDVLSATSTYPQSETEAHRQLETCIRQFQTRMTNAVNLAADLVKNPGLTDDHVPVGGCSLPSGSLNDKTPKCSVINQLGRALHTAQDFWSHSNWADRADPSRPESRDNPPGLGRTDLPTFFDYPAVPIEIPPGLITGCDDSIFINPCKARTTHSDLNKDKGIINPRTGQASNPATPRGQVADNFQRVVTGARAQTSAIWSQFLVTLTARYGSDRAGRMARALTRDTPWTVCSLSGSARRAQQPPNAEASGRSEVIGTITNRTSATLTCRSAVLDEGEWATLPPDTVAGPSQGKFRSVSNGLGTVGGVAYALQGTPVTLTIAWKNPVIGSNDYHCDLSGPGASRYSCSVGGAKRGYHSYPDFEVKGP